MTRYMGSEPIEPFVVAAKTVKCTVENGAPVSGGGADHPPANRDELTFQERNSLTGKVLVGTLFACIFFLGQKNPALGALTFLILPLVILYRLDSRSRRIAGAPICFAAMVLAGKIILGGPSFARYGYWTSSGGADVNELQIAMPLVLAGCLFYLAEFRTCTEKILLGLSLFLVLSGLLPEESYVIIFRTTQYFLFIAIAIGLAVDLTQNGRIFTAPATTGK